MDLYIEARATER